MTEYCSAGFPHSEISGSQDICSSPKLIAACHVLRRLLMPRHSPCALYSLTYLEILVLYSWIMQAITDSFTQNCNCYPLLLQKCSTIKNSQLSSRFLWKTSLLPCFSSHLIHCSVFKVQLSSTQTPYHSQQRSRYFSLISLCLLFDSQTLALVCESSQNLTILIFLRPDANVQSLERFHLFSKALWLLLSWWR